MSTKKGKSTVKYGSYTYNELKEKNKIKKINDDFKTQIEFTSILGTMIDGERTSSSSVFTLGGHPIYDNTYDRSVKAIRKAIKSYFDYSNTTLDNSYYEVNENVLEDYLFLCSVQDEMIRDSYANYVVTDDELINAIAGIDPILLQEMEDYYNTNTIYNEDIIT